MEYTKLTPNRNKKELTKDEISYLNSLSDNEIKEYIEHCEKNYNYYNAMQNGLKLALNCVFGSFGNPFFVCSTTDIAGAITAMGRDTIKYMDKINEIYWYDFWHLDTELHEYLNIDKTKIKPINPVWIHRLSKIEQDVEFIPTQQQIDDGEYQR
jgi:DNA polymerase elongation subunit (family B)